MSGVVLIVFIPDLCLPLYILSEYVNQSSEYVNQYCRYVNQSFEYVKQYFKYVNQSSSFLSHLTKWILDCLVRENPIFYSEINMEFSHCFHT